VNVTLIVPVEGWANKGPEALSWNDPLHVPSRSSWSSSPPLEGAHAVPASAHGINKMTTCFMLFMSHLRVHC
jgi:hypothetical protein